MLCVVVRCCFGRELSWPWRCRLLQRRERQPGRLCGLPCRAVHGRVRTDGVPAVSGGPVPAEPVAEPVPAVRRGDVRERDGADGVRGLRGRSSAVAAGSGQLHAVHAGSVHRRAEADGVHELLPRCARRVRGVLGERRHRCAVVVWRWSVRVVPERHGAAGVRGLRRGSVPGAVVGDGVRAVSGGDVFDGHAAQLVFGVRAWYATLRCAARRGASLLGEAVLCCFVLGLGLGFFGWSVVHGWWASRCAALTFLVWWGTGVMAGFYNGVNGSLVGCVSCLAGLYTDQPGQTACQRCPAGLHQPNPSQSQCLQCSAGTFGNATGQTACIDCAAGSVQALAGQVNCTFCVPGLFIGVPKQTACSACSPGEEVCVRMCVCALLRGSGIGLRGCSRRAGGCAGRSVPERHRAAGVR